MILKPINGKLLTISKDLLRHYQWCHCLMEYILWEGLTDRSNATAQRFTNLTARVINGSKWQA